MEHVHHVLTLANLSNGNWVEADVLHQRLYEFLIEHTDQLKTLFPKKIHCTLDRFTGKVKTDRRLVTSWIRKICRLRQLDLKCRWKHRRNPINQKCESVYCYSVQ